MWLYHNSTPCTRLVHEPLFHFGGERLFSLHKEYSVDRKIAHGRRDFVFDGVVVLIRRSVHLIFYERIVVTPLSAERIKALENLRRRGRVVRLVPPVQAICTETGEPVEIIALCLFGTYANMVQVRSGGSRWRSWWTPEYFEIVEDGEAKTAQIIS